MEKKHCYICYKQVDGEFICEICDELYCDECSYTFSLHYQFQGSMCYNCSDQKRINKLTKQELINNKLNIILDL